MQVVSPLKYISPENRKLLMQKNNWKAIFGILYEWSWVVFAFSIAYFFPYVITYIISLFIIGGKQLACAILTHDASHFSVFKNKKWNDFFGHWFGAYPILQDLTKYRPYHIKHHEYNGLQEDPDILLTRGYPTSRKSMVRKFSRDLFGVTGIKAFAGSIIMGLGYLEYNLGNKIVKTTPNDTSFKASFVRAFQAFFKPIISNLIIFSLLYFTASGWLYLLWVIAYFTTFQFSVRVRSIAEHSVVVDRENPILNTRTTYANFFERILFAPYHVNYHAEHHMLMNVPHYNLLKMHKIIKAKGFYIDGGVLAKSYWQTIKKAGTS